MNQNTVTDLKNSMINQPLTTQANAIFKWIESGKADKHSNTMRGFATEALETENELEWIIQLAFQIHDHPRPDYVLFSTELDTWIQEISKQVNSGA